MEDIEYIVTTPGEADTAPEGARKINANFDRLVAALPTKVSDLTNDLAYLSLTGALQYFYLKNQTYTREEINQKIAAIKTASFEVVDALPASGEENIIYLVPKVGGEVPDTHDEYIWVDGAWELIGSTQIDLSNYLQKTGDASNTTVAFVSEAGEPTSGSKLSSLIGRIVKKLSDIVSGAITVGKATSATKATQDGDGNNISSTYLKKSGGMMTGTLVQKKDDGYLHTDVASLKIPSSHTGWIALCFGQATRTYLGEIDILAYTKGAVSVDFTGTVSPNAGSAVWYYGRYGLRGSISSTPPEVVFARKDATGDCYLLLGGDGFAWSAYSFASLSKIVLGGLGATGSDLGITISALSGDFASLGMTRMTLSTPKAPSEGIEVERARQADAAASAEAASALLCPDGSHVEALWKDVEETLVELYAGEDKTVCVAEADHATSADTATRATQDGNGANIAQSYLRTMGNASNTTANFNPDDESSALEPVSGGTLWSTFGRIVRRLRDLVSGAVPVAKATSADTATRATQDADGNKISETYLKRSGGTMTGTLVQKKGNCSIHTDVASYRIPSQHKGWIALDCGINNAISIVGHITLYRYYTGALSIQVSGYTYAEGIALTRDNWVTPRYGIYGSWYGDMPQVAFVKDGTTGRRYIIIGGDDFAWNAYDYVSLDKVVLGSLGNTTAALPFTWSALSGTVASLGLVAATAGDMSEGVEVQRARQDGEGNDIPSTYATKEELPDVYVDTVPSNPKDGDILITTTD